MSIFGKRVRIVNKFKFTLFLIFFTIIIFNFFTFTFNRALADYKDNEYTIYTVKRGDTLWSIAKENIDNSTDIREYIYNITQLNTIKKDAVIQPGQEILLPKMY